jgi:hypothetical protein
LNDFLFSSDIAIMYIFLFDFSPSSNITLILASNQIIFQRLPILSECF